MKLAQQVAEAAAQADTSQEQKAAEIAQHVGYAKQRITDAILSRCSSNQLSGQCALDLQLMHTASEQITYDCWEDTSYVKSLGTVYRVPDHFVHAETREALCEWLRNEGFKNVSVQRHSDSFYRGSGTQAIIHIEWDE